MNTVHDLSLGGYTFTAEQGCDEGRFVLQPNTTVTAIADAVGSTDSCTTYSLGGVKLNDNKSAAPVIVVRNGQKAKTVLNK